MELITGYKGTPHVTAAQFAALSRGFLTSEGSGVLIDPVTETFETQIQTNNQIRIRSGIGVLQGRAFWVQPGSYDEIPINNGNQGENRIDLVTARYTKNPETSVESINWMVIQGTPTTGTPKVPSYTKGNIDSGDNTVDMPMFQVLIEDITLESVTPVYNMAATDYELDPKNKIQSGDDLNDYTDFGNFLSPSTAVSKSLKNCPLDDQGFSLRIMRGTSNAYRVQEIIAGLGDRLYRHYTGTTWSEWKMSTFIKIIWENASPGSDFLAQTIQLNLKNYEGLIIVYLSDQGNMTSVYIPEINNWDTEETITLSSVSNTINFREIVTKGTGIYFKNGGYYRTYATSGGHDNGVVDNTQIRPYYIYGVKGTN